MSWQKRSIQLILGLPLSLPIVSYAINIGDTYVQSQQNQPLKASINVTDVSPESFSVKIATPDAYRQLGLSKDADIAVHFEQTSSNGGKIILTTNQPVTTPFTDVVLNIENNGSSKTLPKTLLMPISNETIVTQSNTSLIEMEETPIIIGQTNQLDLPVTTQLTHETVAVNTSEATTIEQPTFVAIQSKPTVAQNIEPIREKTLNAHETLTLKVEETRKVYPAGTVIEPLPPLKEKPEETLQAIQKPTPTKPPVKPVEQPVQGTTTNDNDKDTVVYVIQRNDNLWTIANQLAKRNNKNVNTVMKEIIAANPNAFPNNDPSKLRVNMELTIPRYEVMPSALGVKSATDAKQESDSSDKSSSTSKPTTVKKTQKTSSQTGKTSSKTTTANSRKKSEMQIIAPSQKAGSAQGSNKGSNKGSGSVPVVAQVEKKRQTTAQKATKVSNLNQSLVDAEKRLKLQNAKLAQLEQRLKELNKK